MPSAKIPAPISWSPSQYWDGVDGNWSSFDLRVGTPEQLLRVLPSTAASATWVVVPGGCDPPTSFCSDARGGLFNFNQSSSWGNLGPHLLDLEQNLGRNESGYYGTDTLSLGMNNATGGQPLPNQIIAGIETSHYYNGIFGMSRQPMYLDNLTTPRDSSLTTLRKMNLIPSLSWAYTAGARYRSTGVFGSLTLGGSDLSRYTPSNLSFGLAGDAMRDLVVGLQSITSTFANGSSSTLLSSPILTFIDSTLPYIYLPIPACEMFESNLGLIYNQTMNLYLIDDALHQELLLLNPQFTFKIGADKLSTPTVDISLPYSAFDLTVTPPLTSQNASYFPIRRAASDSQLTLGRVFLQEAYVITDYDNNNFTVAQALFNNTGPPDIIPIPWNATNTQNSGNHLSKGSIAGISIGAILAVLVVLSGLAFLVFWKRSRRRRVQIIDNELQIPDESHEKRALSFVSIQEIGHSSIRWDHGHPQELHNKFQVELLDVNSPSGSGQKVDELHDGMDQAEPGNALYELLDEKKPSGSGKEVEELFDQSHPSGSGNEICELLDEYSLSGSGRDVKQQPDGRRISSHGNGMRQPLDEHGPSGSDRYIEIDFAERSPASDTSQSRSLSSPATQASTHTSFGALFDSRRRITKDFTAKRSSKTSSTRSFKTSKTSSKRSTSSYHSSHYRVNLNKELPQIPQAAVKMAIPVSIQSYHPRTRRQFDNAKANMLLPDKAFLYDRPPRSKISGHGSRLP